MLFKGAFYFYILWQYFTPVIFLLWDAHHDAVLNKKVLYEIHSMIK